MLRTVTIAGTLPLMHLAHHRVGVCSPRGQMLVEPGENRRHLDVLIAQLADHLNRERVRKRHALEFGQHRRRRLRLPRSRAQQPVGKIVGVLPRDVAVGDPAGEAPKIFDQHDTQRDGDRPELADRQRLHFLIGTDIAAQYPSVEATVGMGDKSPRDPEHPRISGERAVQQFRELPVVAERQIGADFADLLFNQMIIVDQPFRRRRDCVPLVDGRRAPSIGVQQRCGIVGKPLGQRTSAATNWKPPAARRRGFARAPRDVRR